MWSGDNVVMDDEGFLFFVGRDGRNDQDLRVPGKPDRDRGGGLRHRAGARCRRGWPGGREAGPACGPGGQPAEERRHRRGIPCWPG